MPPRPVPSNKKANSATNPTLTTDMDFLLSPPPSDRSPSWPWRICPVLLMLFCIILSGSDSAAAADAAQVPVDSKKFDLYLLVGQSNMAGRGEVTPQDRQPVDRVLVLNKDDQWKHQGEPIHFDKPIAGVGLGLTFAQEMAAADPGVTIGLIPCAVGGTPIERWMPDGDLFQNALRRARLAQASGTLRGILWHQGESESGSEKRASEYSKNLSAVIEGFRRELDSPDVPVVVGKLGEFLRGPRRFARLVNQQIDTMPARLKGVAVVSATGLTPKEDNLHFDAPSLKEFGARYAAALQSLRKNGQSGRIGNE